MLALAFCLRVTYRLVIKGYDPGYLPGWILIPIKLVCGVYEFAMLFDGSMEFFEGRQRTLNQKVDSGRQVIHGNTVPLRLF